VYGVPLAASFVEKGLDVVIFDMGRIGVVLKSAGDWLRQSAASCRPTTVRPRCGDLLRNASARSGKLFDWTWANTWVAAATNSCGLVAAITGLRSAA